MPRQEVCWCKYPQALYPNWTPRQQKKSKIAKVIATKHDICTIYALDVMNDGIFVNLGKMEVRESTQDKHWHVMQEEVCDGRSYVAPSLLIVWFLETEQTQRCSSTGNLRGRPIRTDITDAWYTI